ncbi:MAG TPA: alpha/beta fold hydrolase [Thermoanaerobaculia bacterium]|nr:alpha/beta fold hydrolase [Thermoanaerobaculia bacterium]
MRRLKKVLFQIVTWGAVALVTVFVVRALDARKHPELKPWHRIAPRKELTAAELTDRFTFADYLAREDALFKEVTDRIESAVPPEDRTNTNRYSPESPTNPGHFTVNWNRTQEIVPPTIRGGALLLHGLTDSPYSMRRLAELLAGRGIYALCLRMPGHGTVPAGLTNVRWEDWLAAARVGGRHVREKIGDGKPLYLVGYSNGGAVALGYSLEVLAGAALPRADKIVLLSPEIGVAPFPRLTELLSKLAFVPFLEKSQWLDVLPEYNPYKYNSFPVNAGQQSLTITRVLRRAIAKAAREGRIGKFPPVLTFQSVVDATVQTEAIASDLYDKLADNGSELVLFDLNRSANARPFLKSLHDALIARLSAGGGRRYRFTLVTNIRPDTREVLARTFPANGGAAAEDPLGLAWPPQFFSLSHVALPFSPDDPLYGWEPDRSVDYGIRLGTVAPRGERSVLVTPLDSLLRLNANPFFPYLERRIVEALPPGK